jgi:hypothetical protein
MGISQNVNLPLMNKYKNLICDWWHTYEMIYCGNSIYNASVVMKDSLLISIALQIKLRIDKMLLNV